MQENAYEVSFLESNNQFNPCTSMEIILNILAAPF